MRISNRKIILVNLLTALLFLAPATKLDLLAENYSTLSLNAKGYFILSVLGILAGILMGFETMHISGRKYGLILFLSLLAGTIVPHEYPYHFRGHIHLLLAYAGGFGLLAVTFFNILHDERKHLQNAFVLVLTAAVLLYMKYMMVNTLSEILIMLMCLYVNLTIYLKKTGK